MPLAVFTALYGSDWHSSAFGPITGANLAKNSAGWSGKGEVLLTTRPHQVDRRQQMSGETGYGQQYGD
jgi:hypothetical protein